MSNHSVLVSTPDILANVGETMFFGDISWAHTFNDGVVKEISSEESLQLLRLLKNGTPMTVLSEPERHHFTSTESQEIDEYFVRVSMEGMGMEFYVCNFQHSFFTDSESLKRYYKTFEETDSFDIC